MPEEPGSKLIDAEQTEGRSFERVTEITDSQSRFEVETPTATASVRGTSYVLTVFPGGGLELWVLPDDDPDTSTVVLILQDGTEIVVAEGHGIVVNPDGTLDGPFTLTEEQLRDDFVLFNLCEDDPNHPDCQVEVGPTVVENDKEDEDDDEGEEEPSEPPPPTEPDGVEPVPTADVSGGGGSGGSSGGGGGGAGGGDGDKEEPSDRRSVVITLSWATGPANLDLHVLSPGDGGEAWAANPCLARRDGTCWAFASGDAAAFGSETVTLRPLGEPDDGDWLNGAYRVWVENTSCQDATFGESNASVTISRAGESVTVPVAGASGDRSLETWNVASVYMTEDGSMAVVGTQSMAGDPCGPPPPVGVEGVGERGYRAAELPAGKDLFDRDDVGSEPPPPPPEPEPSIEPEPESAPEPAPEPGPQPEPPVEDEFGI